MAAGCVKQLRVIALAAACAAGTAHGAQTACNNPADAPYPITDGSQTTINIFYDFADVGEVTDINMDIDISHTYTGDLTADITSPAGTTVRLFERPNTAAAFDQDVGPYGCFGNDIDVLFDDESPNPPIENVACGNNPAFSGTHQPHNAAPNNLSALDGEDPVGTWQFFFMDPISQDEGQLNEACITVSSASVTFDQYVDTNGTCSNASDTLNAASGDDIWVCYTLSNPGDESLRLVVGATPADWSDSLGNDLSSLEGVYDPGDSQTVVFGPFTAGGAEFPTGTTVGTSDVLMTGNSVNYDASNTIFTDESVTVNVDQLPPASGNKPLYFYENLDLSRTPSAVDEGLVTVDEGATVIWTLSPALFSTLNLDASGGSIPVELYLREAGRGNIRNFTMTISGSVSGTIGSLFVSEPLTTDDNTLYQYNIPITGATSLDPNETIQFSIQNSTTGTTNRRVILDPADAGDTRLSRIILPSNSVINVDSVQVFDVDYATDPLAAPITEIQPGNTIYVRAQISDPFGAFDITNATIDIQDPTLPLVIDDGVMTQVDDPLDDDTTSVKIYQYTHPIVALAEQGIWRFDVTGFEGQEVAPDQVEHTAFTNFVVVSPPSLSVIKQSSVVGSIAPGLPVTYSVQVTNSGTGPASNIEISDNLSPYVTLDTGSFSCAVGCPGSGVTLGTPNFTTDGAGKITDWDMIMGGELNPGGASFTIEYDVTVD